MLSMTCSAQRTVPSEIDPFTKEDDLRVVIETPCGSRNKYSHDAARPRRLWRRRESWR
jgi:hypothetical protein